ncbi:hypothetical protein [Streptosporangium sp. KLBMP 9127]|nr:hypothetical protein [Streptosporangium sp. KLBMP 9127]
MEETGREPADPDRPLRSGVVGTGFTGTVHAHAGVAGSTLERARQAAPVLNSRVDPLDLRPGGPSRVVGPV